MANVVTIQIVTDESGAVTGFRKIDASAVQTKGTVKAVGDAGTQMGAAVAAAAADASASIDKVAESATGAAEVVETVGAAGAEAGAAIAAGAEKGTESMATLKAAAASTAAVVETVGVSGSQIGAGIVRGTAQAEKGFASLVTRVVATRSAVTQASNQGTADMGKWVAAIEANTAAMAAMGSRGAQGVNKAGGAIKDVGAHALNSMDSVRLFRDEFGIHIPRSMEKTMAQSKSVMTVLNAMQGAMVAAGGVGIGIALGSEFYHITEEIIRADDEVKKFDRDLSAAAEKKFFDIASITQAHSAFSVIDEDLTRLDKKHSQSLTMGQRAMAFLTESPFEAGGRSMTAPVMTEEDTKRRNSAREIANTEPQKAEKERNDAAMTALDAESKKVASMRESQLKNERELEVAVAKADEAHTHRINEQNALLKISNGTRKPGDKGYLPLVDDNAPDPTRDNAVLVARADASAKNVQIQRQAADEIRKLQNEADNSDLKGFKLLESQKTQAIDEYVIKNGNSAAAINAINEKFTNEEKLRRDELTRDIDRRERDASTSGLTGIPLTQQRGRIRQSDISSDLTAGKYAALGSDSEQQAAAQRDRVTAQKLTDAEVLEEQRRFSDSVTQISASSTEKQVLGFARIRAEGEKQIAELQRRFEDAYGKMDQASPVYQQGLGDLNRGKSAINTSTNVQTAELAKKNADDTSKIERDAYRESLPLAKQREQEIRDSYNTQLADYQRMNDQKEISDTDFLRRKAAAERTMNAQLDAEARAQRDRLAGEIEPFFKDPLSALKNLGEKQASKYAADALEHVTGGRAGGSGDSKRGGGLFDLPAHLGLSRSDSTKPGASTAAAALSTLTVTATTVIVNGGSGSAGSGASGVTSGLSSTSFITADGKRAQLPSSPGVFSTTSGSSGDSLGSASTGSPAVAAAQARMGITDAGASPSTTAFGGFSGTNTGASSGGGITSTGGPAVAAAQARMGITDAGSPPSTTTFGGFSGTSTGAPSGGGITSTGGPAVAAAQARMGITPAGKAPSVGTAGSIVNGVNTGMGDLQNVAQLSKMLNPDSAAGKAAGSVGKGIGKAGEAIGAASGLAAAAMGNGGVGGALQGAVSGMKLGAMIGGPMGAAIGAAAGGVLGFIGLGGSSAAENYYNTEVKPRISTDIVQYGMGAMDYQSAYQDLVSLDMDARQKTKAFGMGGKSAWDNEIHPAIIGAQKQLDREQKAGRSQYGMSAAQFHSGGTVMGFGDYATSPNEGFAHLKRGETVMHEGASATHGDALQLMLAGASRAQMANYYGTGPQQMAPSYRSTMQQASFGGGGHTFNNGDTYHIDAIDTKSFGDALMANRHAVRGSVNASYAENSGGSDIG